MIQQMASALSEVETRQEELAAIKLENSEMVQTQGRSE